MKYEKIKSFPLPFSPLLCLCCVCAHVCNMPPSHPRANRTQVTATPLIVSQLSEECGRSSLGSLIEVPLHSPRHCSSWSPQAVTAMLLYDMGSFAYPTYFPHEEVFRGFVLEPTPTFTGRHLGITYCQHDFVKVNFHPSYTEGAPISVEVFVPFSHGMETSTSRGSGWTSFFLLFTPASDAADALKTCACLLKECRLELAKCIGNPACAANIACIQTCNDRPDETECQIKCGDLFENEVVDQFNECAVSRKKCVPQKSNVGEFPIPDSSALVQIFSMADFSGKWYISSGLDPTFDTFDCQLHEFHPESEKLVGNLTWRIQTPDGGFFTRSTAQRFVQDPWQPGILYNHNNEFLHYEDDWYILSSKVENKLDDYIFVYYRGRNDAWDGYGGAVVYTRSKVLPQSIVPELEKAASRAGLDFKRFKTTDNTCGPEPPLVERLEKKVEEGEKTVLREVEEEVEKLGRTEMSLFQRLAQGFQEFKQDEEFFLKELSQEEMEILRGLKMEATELGKLFSEALPLRKLR